MTPLLNKIVSPKKMEKAALKSFQGYLFHCYLQQEIDETKKDKLISRQLQRLLQKYQDIFTSTSFLPPVRCIDHKIPLLPGTARIAVRTYRYPYYQKMEIEKQIKEMVNAGIIKPSNSTFSAQCYW